MAASTFSSALVQDLCERRLGESALNTFAIISYEVKASSDIPTGFFGRHELLCVKLLIRESNTPQDVIFFIKSVPSDIASRAEYIEEFGLFKKEICVYRNVLPNVQDIFPDFTAKCYYANGEMLIFDHLGLMGFSMASDRSGILNFEHLNCALRSLATMHAASVVFEVKNNKTIPEVFPDAVRENAYPTVPCRVRTLNFNNANFAICELIKVMPKYRDLDRLQYILDEFPLRMKQIYELSQTSSKYYNVFSHGDLWANNFLFKYENGLPVESRMVDFQLTRYAPPILDVITLLTIPTSSEFRTTYLDVLVDNYFNMLKEFLAEKNLEIEDYIPYLQFKNSVEEFRLCGLVESCLFSHLTILPPDLTQSLTGDTNGFEDFFSRKRSEICLKAFRTDKVYQRRLTDMVSEIIDNYILV